MRALDPTGAPENATMTIHQSIVLHSISWGGNVHSVVAGLNEIGAAQWLHSIHPVSGNSCVVVLRLPLEALNHLKEAGKV